MRESRCCQGFFGKHTAPFFEVLGHDQPDQGLHLASIDELEKEHGACIAAGR